MKNADDKRTALAEAFLALFAENGFESTKIADVTQRAGVGKGTFYEYFDSKEAIFLEVFENMANAESEKLPELLGTAGSAREKLRLYGERKEKNVLEYGDVIESVKELLSDRKQSRKLSENMRKKLMNFILREGDLIYGITTDAMESGEFRKGNPVLTSIYIQEMINTYIALKISKHRKYMAELGMKLDDAIVESLNALSADDAFDLLYNGIANRGE